MNTDEEVHAALQNILSNFGLDTFYPNKLTLQSVLEINKNSTYEKAALSPKDIPFCFLRNLFKINAECRSSTQILADNEENDDLFDVDLSTVDSLDKKVNFLDLMVALLLCADSFLQQEISLKMSMCQFSVPLLLPCSNNSQCKLMLWALRDIVKEWCPHDLSESKGFAENSIVQTNMVFYSFVRLKNSSLSKSQVLNLILSRGQQNHNIFIHSGMEGGRIKRKISNGLVEVCWYLPCGRESLDIFPEPVAFANLRGDIYEFHAQFSFLFQVSTAMFVFLDKVEEEEQNILTDLQDVESKLFLIFNRSERSTKEDIMSVKKTMGELNLPKSNIKIKDSMVNEAEFSRKLCSTIKASLLNVENLLSIGNMFSKAAELGLALDESKTDEQKNAAQAIINGIEEKPIPQYKNQQLPLQGENWKRLSKLERLGCRINKSLESGLEDNICKIEEEKEKVRNELCKYKLTEGMGAFIENVSTNDKEKRKVFLKWMKLKLDAYSRTKLCGLRNLLKDKSKPKDIKLIAELDEALLKNSLGIEHYVREMGLIYEVSLYSKEITEKISNLPSLAAEMLLDGYPLELLDGEASNISERWVKDVLMELHKKAGGKSRLLVLTVLGVQSSGKSTLLNTMFGVQFPVSSGRCTRGAYMIFLKVGEDIKNDLNYDFIVLIDTEGLKSPDLAQLEDSYEHDNQLATFVIGLSDVTIINIAMENSTEMKDVLQITAHAFLRMNEIGKKTVCHFVHQNVGGVSAHSKCMAERKHLLDQLNEMTQLAAEMEKRPSIKAFTDVLDYDIEKNNWNIPGLWHGTPPMAPVNTGYSEAVADFKKNLLETMKNTKHDKASEIPDFLEWIESMWRAVKYENFIFSFRNTLVAHAYDNLCKEFSQWEWEFKRKILTWQTEAEYQILNADNNFDVGTWNQLVAAKKLEATLKIKDESKLITKKLYDYYERKDRQINLIEKYKVDFINSVTSFAKELQQSVNTKLDCILELTISTKKAEEIKRKYRGVIEKQVMKLLSDCKNITLSDDQLTQEFEKMWINATVNVHGLKEEDIAGFVLRELRNNFSNLNVNEILRKTDLKKYGTSRFEIKLSHVDSLWEKIKSIFWIGNMQHLTDNVIACCTQFINETTMSNGDYHDSFTRDLLKKVDGFLEECCKNYQTNHTFEIDLKLHICGFAAREFQKMHKKFLHRNSPLTQLEKYKNKYLSDFLDLYKKRDHCQRKANDFAKFCIKPAVEDYINRSLGVDIVDEILTSCYSAEYSSRSYFQYNLLKDLLLKDDFRSFLKYISNYEIYVKDWIFQHILKKMQEDKTLCKLKNNILEVIFKKILDAFNKASKPHGNLLADDNKNITEFISNMRKYLNKDISFSVEDEKTILFQIQSTCHPFINSLKISIEDLKGNLQENYSKSEDITETLSKLPIKPQDELFNRVFGCGEQCPFCKVPCEAGGKEHEQHHAAVHRPQGLARFTYEKNTKLVEKLCTTDVQSECTFRNTATKWEWHPYKQYTTIYPEWYIPPDCTIEASEYWKYVMAQFNDSFAKEYNGEPADLPQAWKKITKAQALKGLKEAFSIK